MSFKLKSFNQKEYSLIMNKYTESNKIFDMNPIVDCNRCQHYYQNNCDGVKPTTTKKCRDFIATRNYDLETNFEQLEAHIQKVSDKQYKFNLRQLIFDITIMGYVIISQFGITP